MPTPPSISQHHRVVDASDIRRYCATQPTSRYAIQNHRLYELLTYGDGLPDAHARLDTGCWNQGNDVLRAVMTYLAQRAFAIHRLPWHHDRSCDEIARDGGASQDALAVLRDANEVTAICKEMRALRDHTHALLKSAGATHVRLRRGLVDRERGSQPQIGGASGYATRVATMAEIAQRLKQPRFHLPVDVLSSWGGGGYAQYPVVIEHEVPIAAVLCFSDALATRVPSRGHALESGEWVVLNTAVDGRMSLRAACVVKCDLTLESMKQWSKETLADQLMSLGRVYGRASSMYSDYHPTTLGSDRWWRRFPRAWNVLKGTPL
jgi:hypothetical protein